MAAHYGSSHGICKYCFGGESHESDPGESVDSSSESQRAQPIPRDEWQYSTRASRKRASSGPSQTFHVSEQKRCAHKFARARRMLVKHITSSKKKAIKHSGVAA